MALKVPSVHDVPPPVVRWRPKAAEFVGVVSGLGQVGDDAEFRSSVHQVGLGHGMYFSFRDRATEISVGRQFVVDIKLDDVLLCAYLTEFIERATTLEPKPKAALAASIARPRKVRQGFSRAGIIGWSDTTRELAKRILMSCPLFVVQSVCMKMQTLFVPRIIREAMIAYVRIMQGIGAGVGGTPDLGPGPGAIICRSG
jgi:hypothetical protein